MDSYCEFALITLLVTAARVYGQACPEGSNVAQMCVPGTYSGERVLIDAASYDPTVSNCSCIFGTNSTVMKLVTYVAPNYPECNSALRLYSSSGNSIRFQCLMSGTYLDTSEYNVGVTTFETYGDLYDKNYCLVLEVAGRVGDTITVTCSADMPDVQTTTLQTTTASSASLDKTGDINSTVTNINDNTVDMAVEQSTNINETSSSSIEISTPGASATTTKLPTETTTLYSPTTQHNGSMTDINDITVDLVMEQSTNTNETSPPSVEISTTGITTKLPTETTTIYSSVMEHNGTMTDTNDMVDLVMGQSTNTNETSSSGIEISSTGTSATTTKQPAVTTTLYSSIMEHNSTLTDTNDMVVDLVMEQSSNTNETSSSGIEISSTTGNLATPTKQPAETTTLYSSAMGHKITMTDKNDMTAEQATNTNETSFPSLEMLTTDTSATTTEQAVEITSLYSSTKQQIELDTTTRQPAESTTLYSSTTQYSEPENVTNIPYNLDLMFTSSVYDKMNDTDSTIQNDTVVNVEFSAANTTSNTTEAYKSKDILTAVVTGTILFNGGGSGASKTIQNIDSVPADILLDGKQLTETTTSNQMRTASEAPVSRSDTFNQVSEAPLFETDFHSQYDIPVATLPTDISNSLIMRASSSSRKPDISGVTNNISDTSNANYSIQFPFVDPLTVAAKQNTTTSTVDLKTMYAFDTHNINHTLNLTNDYESSSFNNNTSFTVNNTDTDNSTMFDVETSGYQTDRLAITMESPTVPNAVSSTEITVNAFRTSPYTTHEARTIMEISEPVDIVANISERPLEHTENSTYPMPNEFARTFDVSVSTANESKILENGSFGSNSTVISELIPTAVPGFQSQVTDSLVNDLTRDSVLAGFEQSTHVNINETDISTNNPILFESTGVTGVSHKTNESVNNSSGKINRYLNMVVDPIAVNEVTPSAVPTPPSPFEVTYKESAVSGRTFNNVDVHLEGSLHTSTVSPDGKPSGFDKTVYDTGLDKRSSVETTTSDMVERKIPDNSSIADVTNSLFPMVPDTNITETLTEAVPDFGERNIQDVSFVHRESIPMFDVNVTDSTASLTGTTDSTNQGSLQFSGVNSATSIPDISGHTADKSLVSHGGDISLTEVNVTQTEPNTIEHQSFIFDETTPSFEVNPSETTQTLGGKEVNHLSFVNRLSEPLSDVSVTEPTPDIATENLNNLSFIRRVDMPLLEVSNRNILEISTTGFDRSTPPDSVMGMGTTLVEKSTVSDKTIDGYFGQNNLLTSTETIPFNKVSKTLKEVTTQGAVILTTQYLPTNPFPSGNEIHTERMIVMKDTEQSAIEPSPISKVTDMLKVSTDIAISPEIQPTMLTETAPEMTATILPDTSPEMKTTISTETSPEIQPTMFTETAPEMKATILPAASPEMKTTTLTETSPEIQTTAFAENAPEIQTATFAETAPEIQTTTFAETAPEIQTTTFAETVPEVQTTTFAETAPEIQTTTFAETAPEIQTTTFAETAPEIQTTIFAETSPEVQTTTFAETAPEIQTTTFAETSPEVQTTTPTEIVPVIVEDVMVQENIPNELAIAENKDYIKSSTDANVPSNLLADIEKQIIPEIKPSMKTSFDVKATSMATNTDQSAVSVTETIMDIEKSTDKTKETPKFVTAYKDDTAVINEVVPEPIKPKRPSNIDDHINIPTTPRQTFNMIEERVVVPDAAETVNTKSDKAGDSGMNVYFDTGSSKSSAFEMNNDTYIIVVGAIVGLVVLAVVIGIFCHNGRKRRSEKVNISGNNAEAVNHQNQAFDNEAADAEQGTIVVQNAQNGGEHNAVSPEVNGSAGDKSADVSNGNVEL